VADESTASVRPTLAPHLANLPPSTSRRETAGPAASAPGEPGAGAGDGTPKPQRAADLLPSVAAPKGGGAVRGLDEKLSVNAATGTCSTSVRIPFSPRRSGFTPALSLSYDSGSGNGLLGFGWSLGLPEIRRKTDKGLPRYCQGDESDVFVLTGADDLVPVLNPDGSRNTLHRVVYGTSYQIEFHRPRIEGLFSRIERWTETATGDSHWRTISRDNATTVYGTDQTSRVADPADPARFFSWQISQSWDDKGNAASYAYTAEDGAGIDLAAACEANRTAATRAAQVYLTAIRYGNVQPYFPDFSADEPIPFPADWMFLVVLDYGDHTPARRPPPPATGRGSCGPTRSPATAQGSRSAHTGASSGCCSSTTSRTSRPRGQARAPVANQRVDASLVGCSH
jgi:hypothetical protein